VCVCVCVCVCVWEVSNSHAQQVNETHGWKGGGGREVVGVWQVGPTAQVGKVLSMVRTACAKQTAQNGGRNARIEFHKNVRL